VEERSVSCKLACRLAKRLTSYKGVRLKTNTNLT
jgi:hypothetical protein